MTTRWSARIRPLKRSTAPVFFAACLLLFVAVAAHAEGTRLWNQSTFDDFEQGTPNGIAITSDGHLVPGPESTAILTTPSTYVWSVAADKAGNAYLGTGTPGTVLKVTPDGKSTTLFTTHDMSVQAVRVGPDGSVYAATLPSGKVYKLNPNETGKTDATATVVFDPADTKEKPKYVWDMAFDAQGRLYVATGAPAAIYRVASGGKPELFFRSDEEHIRCLAFDKDGDLIAGSDGTGLIYRITPAGKGYVLYDSPKKEITAVTVAPDGTIYAAGVGEKGKNTLPPLPVTGQAMVTATITIIQPGSVRASTNNTLIPEGSQLYEIPKGDGPPRQIWEDREDIVYALQWTPKGVLAATGNRGRIYRVQDDGSFADIAHLEASQATSLADSAKGWLVGTANAGKLFRLSHGPAAQGTYTSQVFDAGSFAQWGRAEVESASTQNQMEMYARAGNIENPARAWGDWKEFTPNQGPVGIGSSRFMQWKVVEHPGADLATVGVNYLPANVPPVVDEIVVATGVRVMGSGSMAGQPQQVTISFPSQNSGISFVQDPNKEPLAGIKEHGAVTVRWAAHDDNGDKLIYSLYYRGVGESNWQLLKRRIEDTYYSFSGAMLPDGHYRVKVVASNAPSNDPGHALTDSQVSDDFVIDTTPPVVKDVEARMSDGKVHVSFTASDEISAITHAEFSVDAGRWQYVAPAGNLGDSLTERFDFDAPLPAREPGAEAPANPSEHVIAIRVFDRYHNAVTMKAVAR